MANKLDMIAAFGRSLSSAAHVGGAVQSIATGLWHRLSGEGYALLTDLAGRVAAGWSDFDSVAKFGNELFAIRVLCNTGQLLRAGEKLSAFESTGLTMMIGGIVTAFARRVAELNYGIEATDARASRQINRHVVRLAIEADHAIQAVARDPAASKAICYLAENGYAVTASTHGPEVADDAAKRASGVIATLLAQRAMSRIKEAMECGLAMVGPVDGESDSD